ncbi:hypothetical protein BDB00DRAFT_182456 [Zychaea mexicana]|uniref:uncharacterized protein n=1 Tax=Zychaea mexicana TaxID=64656 RepID=UPI0022FDC288|nr:uncharacterized protein BDB00DRAFT_182456 [Zychaea mexicana]KAI9496057.1 hypothetical protein BDB00DRAFT_182456 [Zychaea mexicana]
MKRKADSKVDNNNPKRKHRINNWSNVSSQVGSLHCAYHKSLNVSLESVVNNVQHYNQGRYRSAIDSTTLDLKKLANKRVALLDIRAAALGKEAQFELGLRVAETIIQSAPSLPTGYLRAGELHST